jgi:ubiquinone/menaquinone biosynthesis C-methylase UbiE
MRSCDEQQVLPVRSGYELWAESYDQDCWLGRLESPYSQRVIAALRVDTTLDLGCGTGRHLPDLADHSEEVLGVDFSEAMLARARQRCTAFPNVQLLCANILNLPRAHESADFVLLSLVVDHIPQLEPLFTSVAGVLRRRGRAFMIDLHPYFEFYRHRFASFRRGGHERRIVVYPHTFTDYLAAAKKASLAVNKLIEPAVRDMPTDLPASLSKGLGADVPVLLGLELEKV